jgi:hypothetical protein
VQKLIEKNATTLKKSRKKHLFSVAIEVFYVSLQQEHKCAAPYGR